MQKALSYLAHADECQVKALSARGDKLKIEYLKLAEQWVELADERRKLLFDPRQSKLH